VSADQAAKLLAAVESAGPILYANNGKDDALGKRPHWFRVEVQERGHDTPNIKVKIPFALLKWGLKLVPVGVKLAGPVAQNKLRETGVDLDELDIDGLAAAFSELGQATIMEVDDEGEKVRIWLE